MKNLLFNFKGCELKGVPYEDMNLSQIKIVMKGYDYLIQKPDYKGTVTKDELKSHLTEVTSLYQALIIDKIEELAVLFDLDFCSNMRAFDYLFMNRDSNKAKLSFLQILDPVGEQDIKEKDKVRFQLHLDTVISDLVRHIKSEYNVKAQYLQLVKNMKDENIAA